jgi:hypothetical protein
VARQKSLSSQEAAEVEMEILIELVVEVELADYC